MDLIQDDSLDSWSPSSSEAGSQKHIGQNFRHSDKDLAREWVVDALICRIDRPARSALQVFAVASVDFSSNLDNE